MNKSEAVNHLRATLNSEMIAEVNFFNETSLELTKESLKKALSFLKSGEAGFRVLMDLTAVDYLEPEKKTKVMYWLHNPTNFERLRLYVYVKRDEKLSSVTDLWEGAGWYERELFDLFGIHFEGHPELKRILMPDDWQGHPLRRDYALTEESVQFKHGVMPKVPSEIIPYVNNKTKFNPLGTYAQSNQKP